MNPTVNRQSKSILLVYNAQALFTESQDCMKPNISAYCLPQVAIHVNFTGVMTNC